MTLTPRMDQASATAAPAPWQAMALEARSVEAIPGLVRRAAVAVRHTEELFHVADREVGHAPGANLPLRPQAFERRDNAGKTQGSFRPVLKVEIEMIRAETGKARLARARDAVSRPLSPPDLRAQEGTIALTGDRTADKILRSVDLRRVDHGHPERQAGAQRFFFGGLRMSSLSKARRPLAGRRDDRATAELDRPA